MEYQLDSLTLNVLILKCDADWPLLRLLGRNKQGGVDSETAVNSCTCGRTTSTAGRWTTPS